MLIPQVTLCSPWPSTPYPNEVLIDPWFCFECCLVAISGISPQLRVQLSSEMPSLWWCQLGGHVTGSPMAGHDGTEEKHIPFLVPRRGHPLAPNTRHGAKCDIARFVPCFSPRMGGGPGGQWLGTHGQTWVLWRSILWQPVAWCLQEIHTVVLWEQENYWYQWVVYQKTWHEIVPVMQLTSIVCCYTNKH